MIALMMETVHTSETSVYSNETTRSNIAEDSHLHTRRLENHISHVGFYILRGNQVHVRLTSLEGRNEMDITCNVSHSAVALVYPFVKVL